MIIIFCLVDGFIPFPFFLPFPFCFSPSLPLSLPLQAMHAHAQFCWSGDNNVKAPKQAMTTVSQEPADEQY